MDQHLLVVDTSKELATLRDASGRSFTVPVAWLPRGASEGASVIVSIAGEAERVKISVGLVTRTSTPNGTDIGA